MFDAVFLLGWVVDAVPALRLAVAPLAERQLSIEVAQQKDMSALANDWAKLQYHSLHRLPFVIPFVLTLTNHSRYHAERIASVSVRVKR